MTIAPLLLALSLAAEPVAFVAVAPGYPGTTAEAQSSMDAFAAALAAQAGWPPGSVTAAYYEKDKAGLERLQKGDVAVAMLTLPFFLQNAAVLKLEPRLVAAQKAGTTEVWSLVAKKGRLAGAAGLDGWQIYSLAGYAPAFVKGPVLGAWGRIPDSTKIVQGTQVLSALRKAVTGENVAVLLDGEQGAALASLPFASDLEVVARSAPLPTGILATVGSRLPADRWKALDAALRNIGSTPAGAAALEAIRMQGFVPLDGTALTAARKAYDAASR